MFVAFLDAIGRMMTFFLDIIVLGLVTLIDLLPLPDELKNAGQLADAIPDDVWWFVDVLAFYEGAGIITTAYLARFILKRIPFIGG